MWSEVSDVREGVGFIRESLQTAMRVRHEDGGRKGWHRAPQTGSTARRKSRPDQQGSSAKARGSPLGRGGQVFVPLPCPDTGRCPARARPPLRCYSRCRSEVKLEAPSDSTRGGGFALKGRPEQCTSKAALCSQTEVGTHPFCGEPRTYSEEGSV